MRRRDFIVVTGGAFVWSFAAMGQSRTPTIGYLNSTSANLLPDRVDAFRQGLSETGFEEGRNVSIEYRWADDQFERLRSLADDLVHRQVDVIVTGFNLAAAKAAQAATNTIPVVFASGVDPVKAGLVKSLDRPGGNITGVNILTNELVPKYVEVLHDVVPAATTLAALVNPTNGQSARGMADDARSAADKLGLQLHVLEVSNDTELERAFARLDQLKPGGLLITPDSFFSSRSQQIAGFCSQRSLPSISPFRAYAIAGGLMSYGGSTKAQGRQVGIYTGRILKGEKPADLPVYQTTTVDLTINLQSAKRLGLSIPAGLTARADEVIE